MNLSVTLPRTPCLCFAKELAIFREQRDDTRQRKAGGRGGAGGKPTGAHQSQGTSGAESATAEVSRGTAREPSAWKTEAPPTARSADRIASRVCGAPCRAALEFFSGTVIGQVPGGMVRGIGRPERERGGSRGLEGRVYPRRAVDWMDGLVQGTVGGVARGWTGVGPCRGS